jgi:hypothetical protein
MMSTLKIVSSGASATAPVLLSEYGAVLSIESCPTQDHGVHHELLSIHA